DNIERAIARGSGADADANAYETVVYEGYGAGGVAILVEALTDNRNRTASDVRAAFSKHDGNLGASGAVAWQFDRRGIVLVDSGGAAGDGLRRGGAAGAPEDVALAGSSSQTTAAPEALTSVREAVEGAGFTIDNAELTMVPKTTVEIDEESTAKKILRLIDAL